MATLLISKMAAKLKPEKSFFSLTGIPESLSYIPSASDPSRKYFDQARQYFQSLGVKDVIYCDLDCEFKADVTIHQIFSSEMIYLSGGSTPEFQEHLRKRELLNKIKNYANFGGHLIGASAGALLMATDLDILLGDPLEGEQCRKLEDRRGIDIYTFDFWPHYGKELACADRLLQRSKASSKPILAIDDKGAILLDADKISALGEVHFIQNGTIKTFRDEEVVI